MTQSKGTPGASRSSSRKEPFTDALARVLASARKAEASKEFRADFRSELQALPADQRERLSALLNIGREAHDVTHVRTSISNGQAVAPLDALALCDGHTLAQRYLERGLAAVCAANVDLEEQALGKLKVELNQSVYERAWSRFGRELASSEPEEWTWFGRYKGQTRKLDKLYVRRGNNAWWSFAAGLDRPLRAQVSVDQQRSKNARFGTHGPNLESLVSHDVVRGRRALARALSSVHARLGKVRPA